MLRYRRRSSNRASADSSSAGFALSAGPPFPTPAAFLAASLSTAEVLVGTSDSEGMGISTFSTHVALAGLPSLGNRSRNASRGMNEPTGPAPRRMGSVPHREMKPPPDKSVSMKSVHRWSLTPSLFVPQLP